MNARELHGDAGAYRAVPPTEEEIAFASTQAGASEIDDDTEWDTIYADTTEEPA